MKINNLPTYVIFEQIELALFNKLYSGEFCKKDTRKVKGLEKELDSRQPPQVQLEFLGYSDEGKEIWLDVATN